jgi:hypothetical protein
MSWEEHEAKTLEDAERIRIALIDLRAFDMAVTLRDLILMAKRRLPKPLPTDGPAAGVDQ